MTKYFITLCYHLDSSVSGYVLKTYDNTDYARDITKLQFDCVPQWYLLVRYNFYKYYQSVL